MGKKQSGKKKGKGKKKSGKGAKSAAADVGGLKQCAMCAQSYIAVKDPEKKLCHLCWLWEINRPKFEDPIPPEEEGGEKKEKKKALGKKGSKKKCSKKGGSKKKGSKKKKK